MDALVLTESTATMNERLADSFLEYYGGTFASVRRMVRALERFGEVAVLIHDPVRGCMRGEAEPSKTRDGNAATSSQGRLAVADTQRAFLAQLPAAPVIVVALSRDGFASVIQPIWTDAVSATREDSVWCIAAARSSLDTISVHQLRQQVQEVVIYERRGVAPIDKATRARLAQAVEKQLDRR